MAWFKNRIVIRYAAVGFLLGFIFPIVGFLMEFYSRQLPYTLGSFISIQNTHPSFWIMELAPFVLAFIAGLVGKQQSLSRTLHQAKKEWETTFDTLSDPVFIIDGDGKIIRCNHAVIDRLNTTFLKLIGRQLTDI